MGKLAALICWVGHSDLRAMAEDMGGAPEQMVMSETGPWKRLPGSWGPIRTLLEDVRFEQIDLLSTYSEEIGSMFTAWLGKPNTHIQPVRLKDPSDYHEVFSIADTYVGNSWELCQQKNWRLCIHLSPGTPTMAAVSLLLGKTKYPARLYQAFKQEITEVELPFEIDLFVMESLREPDRILANAALSSPGEIEGFEAILGESEYLRKAVDRARRTAVRDVNVLLTGESGTGKELFARAIHKACRRRDKPFVPLNCAALPGTLFESEVFGYCKGAFTGADSDHAGAFEQANGGILFLDEVGELSPDNQAKLLRALQPDTNDPPCTHTIRRLKGTGDIKVDVRVIAATNRHLLEKQEDFAFRNDLYYRLATVIVELPPLRERQVDVRSLTQAFLADINRRFSQDEPRYQDKAISAEAQRLLNHHSWPGNIRELKNTLVQAAVMCNGDQITRSDIEEAVVRAPLSPEEHILSLRTEDFHLGDRLNEIRCLFVRKAWEQSKGRNNKAAQLLGIGASTMSKYCKQYGIAKGTNRFLG